MTYSVFIGDVSLDEFFRADDWPAATGSKIDLYPLGAHTGGMIANAAVVFAALGGTARFLWSMNDSALSRSLLEDLEAQGVDTALVATDPSLADSRNIIVLAHGEHTVMTPTLGLNRIELGDAAMEALCGAQYVYTAIGDLRCLRHGEARAAQVLDRIRGAGAQVVLDLDVANVRDGDDELIARTDVLLFNRRGFERYSAGRAGELVTDALMANGTRAVVVTLGVGGCQVADAQQRFAVPGIATDVVDVTGAGDTFGAALLYALNCTADLRAATTFANAAAARAVTSLGARAGAGSPADVVAFARSHGTGHLLDQFEPTIERQAP